MGKGKDNIVFIGHRDENNNPVLLDIDTFYGFHFMLPADYLGIPNIDVSVEYKITNDNDVLAMAWVRNMGEATAMVRYNVEAIRFPAPPQDEIVAQIVERLNNSADFASRIMTIYGPDEPEA